MPASLSDVERLLRDARAFLEAGLGEFRVFVGSGDAMSMRDAAEKMWDAVVQATNAFILALTGKIPMSHFERRSTLRELERTNLDARGLVLGIGIWLDIGSFMERPSTRVWLI